MNDIISKKDSSVINEDSNIWSGFIHKNVNHLSSIMKMIDNSQSELMQAQIDLQNAQHQIRKLETILQIYHSNMEKLQSNPHQNSDQVNKNNDQDNNKIAELRNEILIVQKDNRNVKKHLESVFSSNSQLQNGLVLIRNELKKRDHLIQLSTQESKKWEMEKKTLESTISKLNTEINMIKMKSKEKIMMLKSKLHSKGIMDSQSRNTNEELMKQLKEYESRLDDQTKQFIQNQEQCKLMEIQNTNTKQNFYKEMQNYELKVKEIIEEMKIQKEMLEEESNKLVKDLKAAKKLIFETNENYKQVLLKLENREQEIHQLKAKLMEKHQLEDREKLLKRELDENANQIRNYKSHIIELNLEKEKYLNQTCEQDVAIRHLLEEIKSLQNQLKILKEQPIEQNIWNESMCSSSNIGRPNLTTPESQSTTDELICQSQSLTNYVLNINNRPIDNNGDNDNYKMYDNEIMNNSECESDAENTIKKLANLLRKDQTEYTKQCANNVTHDANVQQNDLNRIIISDDFTSYLEEQLQLIKVAGERNLAIIKRELTIK